MQNLKYTAVIYYNFCASGTRPKLRIHSYFIYISRSNKYGYNINSIKVDSLIARFY